VRGGDASERRTTASCSTCQAPFKKKGGEKIPQTRVLHGLSEIILDEEPNRGKNSGGSSDVYKQGRRVVTEKWILLKERKKSRWGMRESSSKESGLHRESYLTNRRMTKLHYLVKGGGDEGKERREVGRRTFSMKSGSTRRVWHALGMSCEDTKDRTPDRTNTASRPLKRLIRDASNHKKKKGQTTRRKKKTSAELSLFATKTGEGKKEGRRVKKKKKAPYQTWHQSRKECY